MIQQVRAKFGEVTAGFSIGQRIAMATVFVAVLAGLWTFSRWAAESDMAPLFTDLEPATAAAVTEELDAAAVAYELEDRGRTVMVPRDQVHELRLDMSAAGLPEGSEGFGLLDDQGITSTQFQQDVAFQRALQGELARTIRSLAAVEAATVHLVIPQDDIFVGDDIEATASVLVQTRDTLAPNQVQAVVNLVAGSVEGLRNDAITVVDHHGTVLHAPGADSFALGGSDGADGRTRGFETDLGRRIEQMIEAVVGPGSVMATVTAQMDWDRSSSVVETHTPVTDPETGEQMLVAESARTETYTGSGTGESGPLGGEADDGQATSETRYDLSDIDRQYVDNIEITEKVSDGGTIERLHVAVLIDEESSSEAQLAEIEQLVTSAAGIDAERGDTLAVSRLAFDETTTEAIATELEAAVAAERQAAAGQMLRTIVLAVVSAMIVIIAAVQFWRGRRGKEEVEELDLSTLTSSLTAGMTRANLPETKAAPAIAASAAERAAEKQDPSATPIEELHNLVESQPDEVARLLRTWLADRRAVAR